MAQQFGGGGGGAILIASNTRVVYAHNANGNYVGATGGSGSTGYGGGSGGAIRLVAPTVQGNADIRISGSEEGGFGRIRVDALTNTLNLINSDNSQNYATFGANMVVFPTNLPE